MFRTGSSAAPILTVVAPRRVAGTGTDGPGNVHRGEPGVFSDPKTGPTPDAPFVPFVSGSELAVVGKTKRGVTVKWTVSDSSRTKWVTDTVWYKPKRGNTKTFTYTTVIQCPD